MEVVEPEEGLYFNDSPQAGGVCQLCRAAAVLDHFYGEAWRKYQHLYETPKTVEVETYSKEQEEALEELEEFLRGWGGL